MKKHVTWNILMFDPDNNFSRAACIAQKVVLEEIYLMETKTWRKPGIVPPEVLTLKNKCYTEIIKLKEYKNRPDIYSTLCKFSILAFPDKSPNKPVLKIEASFCTSFSYDLNDSDFKGLGDLEKYLNEKFADDGKDYTDEEFERLTYAYEDAYKDLEKSLYEITPVSAAWPYWRELAQNMSTRMGFPALMVPLLTIVPKKVEINFEEFD